MTSATIEVRTNHCVVFSEVPKTDWEKNKTATGCKIPWPRFVQDENHAKQKGSVCNMFLTILGKGAPAFRKHFRRKVLRASIVACVPNANPKRFFSTAAHITANFKKENTSHYFPGISLRGCVSYDTPKI